MKLNPMQQKIVKDAVNWYKYSGEQVFEYAGYAGTGKSVVLNAIIDELNIPLNRIAPMTYIGQAAMVMRMKGLVSAKTIHSWMYDAVPSYVYDKRGNIVMDPLFNRPIFKLEFVPKALDNIDLILVDEAGSVPEKERQEILSRGKKIIATGDLGQIPPVYGESGFLKSPNILNLEDIMRQDDGSKILYLAQRARQGLPIELGDYGDCIVIRESELDDYMVKGADMIIACRNATREKVNNFYRNFIIGTNSKIPIHGEKLVCRKNNWGLQQGYMSMANGLIGTVSNFPGVQSFHGDTFTIDFSPILDRNILFKDLICDYKYLMTPMNRKEIAKNDKYSVGEKLEYAYAITAHMSQGGQFSKGIYMEEWMPNHKNNINYTGITRFSDRLVYVKSGE